MKSRISLFDLQAAMHIRQSREEDLEAIIKIQRLAPEIAQWTAADYADLAADPLGLVLVAEVDSISSPALAGFAAFHHVADEAELRNIAVDPDYRGRGLGRELVAEGRRRLLALGVRRIFLEVRASNIPAQRLYLSARFRLHSRRRNYYRDPPEDALVLTLDLAATPEVSAPDRNP